MGFYTVSALEGVETGPVEVCAIAVSGANSGPYCVFLTCYPILYKTPVGKLPSEAKP
jgi:hypothetical protein